MIQADMLKLPELDIFFRQDIDELLRRWGARALFYFGNAQVTLQGWVGNVERYKYTLLEFFGSQLNADEIKHGVRAHLVHLFKVG